VDVARQLGLGVDEVIDRHIAAEYTVAFCGFSPGFGYLSGLDPALHLERRATPRTRVPRGAVAIAAGYSAVYPSASPGGWHLIGSTTTMLWDERADPPAALVPGRRVRFRRVGT
jgi:KipI family sensor histidine kinase inhibitor